MRRRRHDARLFHGRRRLVRFRPHHLAHPHLARLLSGLALLRLPGHAFSHSLLPTRLTRSTRSARPARPARSAHSLSTRSCDCADGSDEKTTSACSHLSPRSFVCIGDPGAYLPNSRVGDGICDCCDGSDELVVAGGMSIPSRRTACADSCELQNANRKTMMEETIAKVRSGLKVRTERVAEAKVALLGRTAGMSVVNETLENARKGRTWAEAQLARERVSEQIECVSRNVVRINKDSKGGGLYAL